jgi:tRNA threonylcarbamoyladenosine biosynthesis protein TsaE
MKPSMNAANTEQTAPEMTPITMSPSRQYTLEAFPARLTVSSLEGMRELAAALARHLHAGDVIAVDGPLGSGKTTFVAGLASYLVGGDPVSSPTFTFWHRYRADGRPSVEHLDLYRVENESDLTELGLEEAFSESSITVVEWPERAPSLVGTPAWRVTIAGSGEMPREVTIVAGA